MPAIHTRVNLTLPDEVVAVLDRMGKHTGAGRATIVREWLIEGLPHFVMLADAMEMASRKNIDAFKVMSDTLKEMTSQADQMQLEIKSARRGAMRKKAKP
jgi:predicted DNA-binding protein